VGDVYSAVPAATEAFSAANHVAAAVICGAGSATSQGMLASHLAACAAAQASNPPATVPVGRVHSALGGATDAPKAAVIAADNAWRR
jgi:hypothetical protein